MTDDGVILPVRSVGVQGDARSYRKVLALDRKPSREAIETVAPALTNSRRDINRVIAQCGSKAPLDIIARVSRNSHQAPTGHPAPSR